MAFERNPAYKYKPLIGSELAKSLDIGLKERAAALFAECGVVPRLEILSNNGDHAPSQKYIDMKIRRGMELDFVVNKTFVDTSAQLTEKILELNADHAVHGIIVQLPLKDGEPYEDVVNKIAAPKDVDGLGHMPLYTPATALAIQHILKNNGLDYRQKRVALVGKGKLVNGPLYSEMIKDGASHVRVIEEYTPEAERQEILDDAFIVVTAVGKEVLDVDSFSDYTGRKVIVDAGTAEVKKDNGGKGVVGDVSEALRLHMPAHWFASETIGGVGPLTIRSLLGNTALAAERLTQE